MDEKLMNLSLEEKVKKSKEIIMQALELFGNEKLVVAFTGGKDSTLLVWLFREVCREMNIKMPRLMFINEGAVFEEVLEFVDYVKNLWNLEIVEVKNDDVLSKVKKLGDKIKVSELNERNRKELERIGFKGEYFIFNPESFEGNHLMKTVPMNIFIEENGIEAVATGIRWDEQEARADEVYFSPRENPKHMRVHPILHFRERDVWDAIFKYKIPFNKLYAQGYRSLGAKYTTKKVDNKPAWEQDMEKIPERAGRAQDKENIMRRLRELGYM